MRKAKPYASMKTGQIKASPIESEIHPSHKTPFYALCISRLHRAVTSENPHQNDAPFLRRRWLFRIRFSPVRCRRRETYPENHTRPASFCTSHLASCFDDSAKGAPASSARKRACARYRSLKVALAGKSIVTVRNTHLKTATDVDVSGRRKPRKQGYPKSWNGQAGGFLNVPLKTGLKTSTERKTICQDTHLYVI